MDTQIEHNEVRISKRTGKPVRPISDLQKEILAKAREEWQERRRETKAQKALVFKGRKEKYEKDKEIVENEMTKLKKEIEEKLKIDLQNEYENKLKEAALQLKSIQEDYETKLSEKEELLAEKRMKEELRVKYEKKPKKVIEVYSTDETTDIDTQQEPEMKRPIAVKKERIETPSPNNFLNDYIGSNPFNSRPF